MHGGAGVIERKSFERVLPNTLVDYSIKDGLGCDIPAAAAKAQGKPVPDEHLNEHATCFNLKDRGLIVISSCGHAGIVNSTRQAMKVSGVQKVHAIVGGFHLFPADEAYIRQTVAELKALQPDVVIPQAFAARQPAWSAPVCPPLTIRSSMGAPLIRGEGQQGRTCAAQ